MSDTPPGLKLDLADGQRWLVCPVDDRAAVIVAELGKVMCLGPGDTGRALYVAVSGESNPSDRPDAESGGAVVCCLPEPTNPDMQVIGMERIASAIARESLVRGGLLLHAALAEYQGSGFVMAGPGGVGKSTASRRLPSPWRSICDDMTLVVRDGTGRFWAHPWPTWSRFFLNGPEGSWPVEQAVPLRAIFFLLQSPADELEPLNSTQAAALLLESALNLTQAVASHVPTPNSRIPVGVSASRALASAVPAYSLRLGLDGRFWEGIGRVLPVPPAEAPVEKTKDEGPMTVVTLAPRGALRVVYTGTSMNPTLVEPELLEVKPYGAKRVWPGDVVCLKSPEADMTVVHRVVSVGPRSGRPTDGRPQEGIRTRGDNNLQDDPWVLQPEDIIGRVTSAQRGARRRKVPGGRQGLVVLRRARFGQMIWRCAGLVPHKLYSLVAGLGPFDRLLPRGLRPRLVRFDARYRVFLKLLSGRLTVGQYDDRREEWRIRRPFRLFVDEESLPSPKAKI